MRIVERVLSLLLALALVVGSVLLALEVAWAVARKAPLLVQWHGLLRSGRADAWDTAPVRTTAVVVAVVGLLLLLVALKPRRAPRLPLATADDHVDAALTRRSLRSVLVGAASRVDGLSGARATVSRRRASVTATSRLGSPETAKDLTDQLQQRLQETLDDLQLTRTPRLKARVLTRTGRSA